MRKSAMVRYGGGLLGGRERLGRHSEPPLLVLLLVFILELVLLLLESPMLLYGVRAYAAGR